MFAAHRSFLLEPVKSHSCKYKKLLIEVKVDNASRGNNGYIKYINFKTAVTGTQDGDEMFLMLNYVWAFLSLQYSMMWILDWLPRQSLSLVTAHAVCVWWGKSIYTIDAPPQGSDFINCFWMK